VGIAGNEREPGWFPLIDRAAAPQGLLSFRYTDGLVLRISPGDEWESGRDKVAPEMNPAAVAALVTLP
jgi:hypothetical protein